MKMFKRGKKITTLSQLLEVLNQKQYVFFQGKPKHPQVMMQMTLNYLEHAIQSGYVFYAKLKKATSPDEADIDTE